MRNLLQLLARYSTLLLFVLLQLLALALILGDGFQQARVLALTRDISGSLYQQRQALSDYFQLKTLNDSLALENARLRNRLPGNFLLQDSTFYMLEDTAQKRRFRYLPARVINNSFVNLNNYHTLSKGRTHGVRPLMGVMSEEGVVGVVRGVSKHFATVVTLQHTGFRLSARIARNGEIGSLSWSGDQEGVLQLNDVPRYVELEPGWRIETSPYSDIFPEGLPIGEVVSVDLPRGSNFLEAQVQIDAPIRKLTQVYIIENLMRTQQDSLEKASFQ